jgi:hypothetical protein
MPRPKAPKPDLGPARKPSKDNVARVRAIWEDNREQRRDINEQATNAREILKNYGFSAEAIAIYAKLCGLGDNRVPGVLAELKLLLEADPQFSDAMQPDMFAHKATEAVREATLA